MTFSAWIMLGVTWAVIGFFTIRFFLKIMKESHTSDMNDGHD